MPRCTIKVDDTVYPAFPGPHTDPRMISSACIAHNKFTGHALAAEHSRHKRSIVETDSFFRRKDAVYRRQITAFYCSCFLLVICHISDYIIVDLLHFRHRITHTAGQFRCLCHRGRCTAVIYILVWPQERRLFTAQRRLERAGCHCGVFCIHHILINCHLIISTAFRQRKYRPAARRQIICIRAARPCHLYLQPSSRCTGITGHHIAIPRVGIVNSRTAALHHLCTGSLHSFLRVNRTRRRLTQQCHKKGNCYPFSYSHIHIPPVSDRLYMMNTLY